MPTNKKRYYCSVCGSKRVVDYMCRERRLGSRFYSARSFVWVCDFATIEYLFCDGRQLPFKPGVSNLLQ